MNLLYTQKDYEKALQLKANLLKQAILLGFVCLLINTILIVLKFGVPWGESTFWYLFGNCVVSVAYGGYLIYFIGVPFKIARQYCSVYRSAVGVRDLPEKAIYLGISKTPEDRDGIEYYQALFYPGQDHRGKERVLKVYVEVGREDLAINIGDEVNVLADSGIMVGYEVLTPGRATASDMQEIYEKIQKKLGLAITAAAREGEVE